MNKTRVSIKEQGLVFVIMPKIPSDFNFDIIGPASPDIAARNAIEAYLASDRADNSRHCLILPYPSNYTTSLVRVRTGEVQRTGYHNIDFGRGTVKRLPSLKLSWDIMNLTEFTKLQNSIFDNEFWLYYYDTTHNRMCANLFYCEDDGLQKGEVWVDFDEDGAALSGYKNVQLEFIATLNDNAEVMRAKGIAFDITGRTVPAPTGGDGNVG